MKRFLQVALFSILSMTLAQAQSYPYRHDQYQHREYRNDYYYGERGRYYDHRDYDRNHHAGRSVAIIGGSAAAGAVIGAAAGHGQGAALGAIIGGVAGVVADQAVRSHDRR